MTLPSVIQHQLFLTRKILLSIVFVFIINTSSSSGTGRGGGIYCRALVLGAVGGVTETSAIVGFRTDAAISNVQVQYSTDPSFAASRTSSSVSTDSSTDFTGKITLNGLQSDTIYYYRIVENGTTIQSSPFRQQFKTFPSPQASSNSVVTFVVFADAANNDRPAQSYSSAFAANNPLFAMQIGDFDHSDPQGLTAHRTMHQRMRDYTSRIHGSQFAQYVLTKMGFIHIWDDHDYCGQDTNKDCSLKTERTQAFREYYPTYPEANPTDGIYHKFVAGNAEIFVLDARSQRDPGTNNDDDNKSMLGSNQRTWLLEGLRDSKSHWKIVISSSGANKEARAGTSIDNWTAYQNEAILISQYIHDNEITNIVMISGDIHTGGGIDNGINNLWGIPEVTVPHTNLARGNTANLGIWSQGVYSGDGENGEGYVRVTVSSDSLALTTLDRNGNERISWQYDSDEVGSGTTTTEPPTCAPSCFSGIATVQVLVVDANKKNNNKNTTPTTTRTLPMDQLKVGDYVQIANGNYQPIYAFAHRDATFQKTDFLQIFFRLMDSNSNNNTPRHGEEAEEESLEVSSEHLIYVVQQQQGNKGNNHHNPPIPARSIKVGDKILRIPLKPTTIPPGGRRDDDQQQQQQRGGGSTTTVAAAAAVAVTVIRIQRISRTGLYAPLTADGTIVVNGIISSCYVSLQTRNRGKHNEATEDDDGDNGFVHLSTGTSLMGLSQHFLIHMTLSPLRIVCTTTIMNMIGKKRFCGDWQHHQDEEGVPTMVMNDFVALGLTFADWIQMQSWPIQLAFLVLHCMIFGSCLMVEWAFLGTDPLVKVALLLGFFILIVWNKRHELRINTLHHGCICPWVSSLIIEASSSK